MIPRHLSGWSPLLLLTLTVSAAEAQLVSGLLPIDDFESGGFTFTTAADETLTTNVNVPGFPAHAMLPTREVRLADGPSGITLITSPASDDGVFINVPTAGNAWLKYNWGFQRDLTVGGIDRISMVISGTPGKPIGLTIDTGTQTLGLAEWIQGSGGPQILTWELDGSALPWSSQAVSLRFYFPAAGTYSVWDIRFGEAGALPVDFEGGFVATQIPPVPSPALWCELYNAITFEPLYQGEIALANAWTDAAFVPQANWTWDSGDGLGAEVAYATFEWTEPGGVLGTEFDLTFDAVALGNPGVDLFPPDPVHGPESIGLGFPVVSRGSQGEAVAVAHNWLTVDFDERQLGSLEFSNVGVTPNSAGWTDGFTLHFRMDFSGMNSPDDAFPLFHVTWGTHGNTQSVPTDVPRPAADSRSPGVRLSALPSVTAGSAEIRASRPLDRAVDLWVHDVAGRRIRTLSLDGGETRVTWDGRDGAGRPTAAGVYFVRLAGTREATARVVRVR